MRGMLHAETPTAAGIRYHARTVRNLPAPVQPRLPLLIGGGGEKVTLKLVARYADACNIGGGVDTVRRKEAILQEHCRAVGRDHREIERTTIVGAVVIRDSRAEAQRVFERLFEWNGRARPWTNQPVGTPDEVAAAIRPYLGIGPGYRHLLAGFPPPYDEESMTRFATEVRPRLERGLPH
jgi:alkanesulfonate monooxygenase SsuD/methylene tetrahydromethanopterin reductase-like flavin-dependent oxidoreductase (luciferase family)